MTPQERELVAELFDRLASLESSPRDPDAERAIAEGLARAPHAPYALVQTVLVQDEALRRAHARIEELEGRPADEPPRGFLDNMRETLFGGDERRGSVPSVRPGSLGTSGVWGQQQPGLPGAGQSPMGSAPIGMGGSFLGTAAASAAGVIGGAMLLNGIRSMFGHPAGGSGALDPGAASASPWTGSAANSDLARAAGIDNVGRDPAGGRYDDASTRQAGLFGGDDQDGDPLGSSEDPDDDPGDDTDFAGDLDGGDVEDV